MSTPDYILTQDYHHYISPHDTRILKAGSFVRPIQFCYLPAHITENRDNQWIKYSNDKMFCFTYYGMIAIPKDLLRQK